MSHIAIDTWLKNSTK